MIKKVTLLHCYDKVRRSLGTILFVMIFLFQVSTNVNLQFIFIITEKLFDMEALLF